MSNRVRRPSGWSSGGWLLLSFALAAGAPLKAQELPTGIQIPVIVNLYGNSGATEQEARDAIVEANKILRQAAMKLVVVKVNDPPGAGNGDDGAGGGTAGDASFTRGERDGARTFGGKELKVLPNQKGIKISFAAIPEQEDASNPGISVHRNPTILVKDRGDARKSGETIAHEVGHVVTLSTGHKIDAATNANAGGHAPDQAGDNGNGNAMAPSERRTGAALTADQVAEMKKSKYTFGKCASQFERAFPAVKDPQGFGAATDDLRDQGAGRGLGPDPALHDLQEVVLTTLTTSPTVEARVTVAAALPGDQEIDAVYGLGLDTDANAATGVAFGGRAGIDRIVRARLSGNRGLGTFSISGEVEETVSAVTTPLPVAPLAEIEEEFPDLDGVSTPAATSVLFVIPKALLGISATVVPVVATAGPAAAIFDTVELNFDLERWLRDATLATSGTGVPTPGQAYPFALSGLAPGSAVSLYLDDALVFTGTLDGGGGLAGDFVFPASLSIDEIHFLTAQDETGEFGYSITCPRSALNFVPALGHFGLLAFGLLLLAAALATLRGGLRKRPTAV